MESIDRSLIYQARRFVTGANTHRISTWIFCYEMAQPGSLRQKHYEGLLRNFVAMKNRMLGIHKAKRAWSEE
jgi:hypothetical protein